MVLELVEIDIKPGVDAAFETAFAQAMPLLERAKGCLSARLMRAVETPNRYRLFVQWETLEHHNQQFRGSPDHKQMLALIGPFFERSQVEHNIVVLEGFVK